MTPKTHLVLRIMALFIPAFALFLAHSRQDSVYYDQYRKGIYEKMPYQSPEQIHNRLDEINDLISLGPEKKGIASGRMYFSLLYELDFTGLYCEQIQYDKSLSSALNAQGGRSWSSDASMDANDLMSYRYCQIQTSKIATNLGNYTPKEVLHSKEWEVARDAYVPLQPIKGDYPRTDKTADVIAFFAAYAFSTLLARGYIHQLIRDSGGRVWLAMLSSFGYWYFQIVWIHLLIRGFKINPKQQLQQALRFASTTLSALLSLGAAVAQTKKPKEERVRQSDPITFTLEQQTLESYHGVNGAQFHREPVIQTSVTAAHRSGCFTNIWHSIALQGRSLVPNYGDEIDLSVGCSKSFNNTTVSAVLVLFDIVPLQKLPRGDLLQPEFRIAYKLSESEQHAVSPFVWVRYVFPVGEGPKAGLFVHYGANHSWQISPKWSLNHNVELLHDVHGAFGFNKAWVAGWYGQLQLKVTEKLRLIVPSFRLSTPITRVDDGRATLATFGGGFVYSFGSQ